MAGATPDSLLAFHDAGYREMAARLGPGTVLDIGCGVGNETARLAALGRSVLGVDYDADTAVAASADWGPGRREGLGVHFAGMDGARLGLRGRSVDWACSSADRAETGTARKRSLGYRSLGAQRRWG